MIKSLKHKGLRRLYEDGDARAISGNLRDKIEEILFILDTASTIDEVDLPGYRLHALTGNLRGYWSIRVSGNWRIIFRVEDGTAEEIDLVDYH